MKQEYRQAFTEVYNIFELMPSEILNKIPQELYSLIKEERDKDYFPDIKEPLENQKLKNETIIILGLIYRDFLCLPEERIRLQKKDAKELQEAQRIFEEEIREKYNPDKIFENRNQKIIKPQTEESLVIVEEKWYKKIFNIIKSIFNKKG